jgi:hypothetical protein
MTIHMKRIAECDQCHKRLEVPDAERACGKRFRASTEIEEAV